MEQIPEEIHHNILQHTLTVSCIDKFLVASMTCSMWEHEINRFSRQWEALPDPTALRVCKTWLRIGTPLFYQTIVVRKDMQVRKLSRTLRNNPSLGELVRNLRLLGGYVYEIADVAHHLTNVHSLALTVDPIGAYSGLYDALVHFNPTNVYIRGTHLLAGHKGYILAEALCGAVKKWTSLRRVYIDPFKRFSRSYDLWVMLRQPKIMHISISLDDFERLVEKLDTAAYEHLKSFHVRGGMELYGFDQGATLRARDFEAYLAARGAPEDIRTRAILRAKGDDIWLY